MLIPINWAKDYVNFDIDTEVLAEKMIMTGSNVEGITKLAGNISNVVVGKILSVEQHPNADKLVVCQVDIGSETIQIVTGAPNVEPDQLVPVALHGAVLPGGIKIKKGKLRGEVSEGMLCSGEELELTEADYEGAEFDGILILKEDYPLGMDIKDALELSGEVIDFEITSNRSDCLSVLGMAREIALTLNTTYKEPEIKVAEGQGNISDMLKVVVEDSALCPHYAARVVKDVKIEPSPQWMKRRLAAAGVRPINNIVDITNYVMLELGQPMHAFDYDKVSGGVIKVRRAKEGERLVTIDHKDRELTADMLVIADSEKPCAIAGVMGGANSEISDETTTIILESAIFDGASVRDTSKLLGLRSEASSRFEKGIDVNVTIKALDRAAQLIQQLGAGTVVNDTISVLNDDTSEKTVTIKWSKINELLGLKLSADQIVEILKRDFLKVSQREEYLDVTIPTYRLDLGITADLAEEVARIYGYDKIPMTLMENSMSKGTKSRNQRLTDAAKSVLNGMGLYEAITYSFTSPKVFETIGITDPSQEPDVVKIANPLGEDQSVMRTTLIPSILEVLSRNYNRRLDACRVYEFGKSFIPDPSSDDGLPNEIPMLTIGAYGDEVDFYLLKGWVESTVKVFGLEDRISFERYKSPTFHPGRTAKVLLDGECLGVLGEIHPKVAENYQINNRVYMAELKLSMLFEKAVLDKTYSKLPKYPAVVRDLAIVLKKDILAGDVYSLIVKNGGGILEDVQLFDIYEGNQIPEGFKSMAYSLTFRAQDRTLKEKEVNERYEKILKALENQLDAKLR